MTYNEIVVKIKNSAGHFFYVVLCQKREIKLTLWFNMR